MVGSEKVDKVIRAPNELPAGWRKATLAEVAEIIMGQSPSSQYYNTDGKGLPFFQGKAEFGELYPKPLKWCSQPNKVAQKDDVLMSVRAPVGPTNLAISECCIGRGLAAIRLRNGVPSRYVLYYLRSIESGIDALGTGTTFKAISGGILRSIPIPVAPATQQDRIVAEIEKQFSRLDEAVANLKRVKANLKRYKAAVLKAAVEGKLAPTERPWKQAGLGDIATSIRNGYSKKPDAEQGTRIFRISAVRPMELNTNDVRYLSGTPADYEPFLVEPGDVLFTRYNGSRDYVGVCARVPTSLPPTVYPDKLIRVRVPDSMLIPEFFVILASTGGSRKYIESKIRTTAGQSGISGGDLKSLPLALPCVAEQQCIVAEVERHLSVIEELEASVEANLTRADRLRQSILQRAFAGRLVPYNPDNKPAGILTNHIGVERTTDIQNENKLQ